MGWIKILHSQFSVQQKARLQRRKTDHFLAEKVSFVYPSTGLKFLTVFCSLIIEALQRLGYKITVCYNLDERLQRVKPLRYPPANLIRGKLSFYWSSEHHSELSPPRKECK